MDLVDYEKYKRSYEAGKVCDEGLWEELGRRKGRVEMNKIY